MSAPAPEPRQAQVFAALGDTTRLALVSKLATGERFSIGALSSGSTLTRQAVTKHLKVLEHAGVVRHARSGRETVFELNPAPLDDLRQYLQEVSQSWDRKLKRLRTLVEGGL
jgi:DNA-binding transcriptional ArsR family regulator